MHRRNDVEPLSPVIASELADEASAEHARQASNASLKAEYTAGGPGMKGACHCVG